MINKKTHHRYIAWGLTALAVVVASLLVFSLLNNLNEVGRFFASIIHVLMPFIYGFVMAFLTAPAYNRVIRGLKGLAERYAKRKGLSGEGRQRFLRRTAVLARFLATVLSLVIILAVVTALIAMLLPQIISGITELCYSLPESAGSVASRLKRMLDGENPEIEATVLALYDQLYETVNSWISSDFLPNLNKYLSQMTTGVVKILVFLKNFFIGLIVMVYGLNMKELLAAQCKKTIYALFPLPTANDIVTEVRYVKTVFSNFIIGKLIDSCIIAVICYICMSIMKMPYSLLISVFVGVTNVIPFFGPFIGAIPGAFILLMVSPLQMLQFLIFILIIQQFDGNILGPRILGSTTGLSSFWVLFSILFFGGIWGIVGMVVGIPTFAVLSRLFQRLLSHLLERRRLSKDTGDYQKVQCIEKAGETYCYRRIPESDLQTEKK